MSPILKRDVAEQVRQARRLAAAAGITDYDDYEYELDSVGKSRNRSSIEARSENGVHVAFDWTTQPNIASESSQRPRSFSPPTPPSTNNAHQPLLASGRHSMESLSSVGTNLTTMSAKEGKWADLKGLLFSVSLQRTRPPARAR